MMKTVSYVVTLYNKERFLPYLLEGLRRQVGNFKKEYIFVNDGSVDGTVASLRSLTASWKDVVIIEQKNSGPAIAINRGFTEAQGDFIKPVDGDDFLLPWSTQYLLDAIDATGCPVSCARVSLQKSYSLNDLPFDILSKHPRPDFLFEKDIRFIEKSIHNAQLVPSAWIADGKLLKAVGGADPEVFIQDYSMELRLAAVAPFVCVNAPILLSPDEVPERLSNNGAQILHDLNFALLRFLREGDALSPSLVRFGLKRGAGRAWAWARRHGGKGHVSKEFAVYLCACLGLLKPTSFVEKVVCSPFRDTSPIRIP